MPFGDGTGPFGKGPGTGQGMMTSGGQGKMGGHGRVALTREITFI